RIASLAKPGERDGALALNEDNIERQVLVEGAEVLHTQDVLKEGRNEMDVDVDVNGAEDPGMDGAEDGDEDGDADSDGHRRRCRRPTLSETDPLYQGAGEAIRVPDSPLHQGKAYLNPNGLRYHKQKGTCVMESGQPCALFDANVAMTSEALRPPKAGRANRRIAQPKQRPAGSRQSARLASLSSAAAAKDSSTRGSVKARSKTKAKAEYKSTPKYKFKPSRPSPASAASPTPSYSLSRAADFDQSDSDSDSASDFDSEMSGVDSD
ncbi:hypothetical protein B0H13DRAFT_2093832, partial [Mycena leptocephala]